ncbi:PAS domain-containing sensor histidine kinase [Allomuricauda sp. XS_ASV26]|uniref:histidine kinase n=1 Tax=Flagellimonas marinaquae TaxID=254955 RepID=A0AA48KKT4_9FLAO|nr:MULTISPECIES: ATP-binding protein [Allomuricauda]MCA0958712.1 PAS domain-containing protein [Allomuricauda ruestringensis]USD26581.1 ATP-binding protein [Allomuricauda aquimarina]BDW92342.1 sensor histidine kinase [Allomuricauda aquimarina]
MASRNFYIQMIIRVLFLTFTALVLAFSVSKQWYFTLGISAVALILLVFSLITFLNRTNRKIAYFFDAIKNEDFTLRFPEGVTIESFKELNKSLNRVNGLIQEVHVQLQVREQYYQEILKQASIGIMTYNDKGHILFANPTLEQLLDYTPLNHIKQLKQVDENLYRIFKNFKPFERKLFQLTNEREQTQLALKSTHLSLDGQSLLLVVVQDIHKELDEKETESWVRLIRVLTHEIMNTITPIASISDSIIKYYRKGGKITPMAELEESQINNTLKGLEVIKEQGSDLMDFVQSYRSLLHVPEPNKSLVKGKDLLEKINVLMSARLLDGESEFKVFCKPEDLEFYIDEKQIGQVLINLVKNALQSVEYADNGKVHVMAGIDTNGSKYIEILDNGPGISPEMMDEIFVPFFTTKSEGTGIGLSLSKRVMQLHGGNIQVRSIPKKETVFRLTFA